MVALEYESESAPAQICQLIIRQTGHTPPVQDVLPLRRRDKAPQNIEKGRFSRARCPDNCNHLTCTDIQVDVS